MDGGIDPSMHHTSSVLDRRAPLATFCGEQKQFHEYMQKK
jgi:hypothetical protein